MFMRPFATSLAAIVGALALEGSLTGGARAGDTRPNVVVILADDLGYGDISAQGGRIPTPNLDALARSGVRFTSGYVTAAVCAPSRAGLLTGRAQTRFGFEFNPVGRDERVGPPTTEVMIPALLRDNRYDTGIVGKWHLGKSPGYHPLDRGFGSFYGVLDGGTSYFPDPGPGPGDEVAATADLKSFNRVRMPVYRGREVVEAPGHLTERFTDEAVEFVSRKREVPFFLYLAYTAPHTPLMAAKTYLDRFRNIEDTHHRVYAAMVSSLDDGVGRLLQALDATGQRDNTLVVFLSDNGCPFYIRGACSNAPLSGHKALPWDGGIRVPFIMSWPAKLRPGVSDRPVSSLDILPTIAAVAGAQTPKAAEGLDLVRLMGSGGRARAERTLFWRMGPNHVVRTDRWSLVVVNKSETAEDPESLVGRPVPDGVPATVSPLGQYTLLYDIRVDPGQTVDVAARHPEVVSDLKRRFAAWDASNIAPMYTSRRQFSIEVNGRKVQLFN
ncbi:sulfatase-like hydrolase/transferase [Phenylobacterium sp.]|uniref:sulfatase-like hydrolase/transferase n=1 Tax=Phenylobacterium sp. TaxID=1871053 RepID=UPI0025E8EF22|nr:sulfatase-like hydrolase/transferase [Phenylobacterium sp.]MCA3741086.1 sulfatase-like hydrolase/transferase [Phenylobacterium sp.]